MAEERRLTTEESDRYKRDARHQLSREEVAPPDSANPDRGQPSDTGRETPADGFPPRVNAAQPAGNATDESEVGVPPDEREAPENVEE